MPAAADESDTEREERVVLPDESALKGLLDKGAETGTDTFDTTVRASTLGSGFTMANNILGAGVLTLPYAFRCAGVATGVFLLLLCCVLSCYGHMLLVAGSDCFGCFTFKALIVRCYGRRAGNIAELCVAGSALGLLMGYACLLGDFLTMSGTDLAKEGFLNNLFSSRAAVLALTGMVILFPLSMLRNLRPLRHTSAIALVCVCYAIILCSIRYVQRGEDSSVKAFRGNTEIFSAISLLSVAYCAQYNTLRYYEELSDRSMARMWRVVGGANSVSAFVYAAVGLMGYLTFGEHTHGNILNDYKASDHLAVVARLSLSFTIAFAYPIAFNSARASIIRLFLSKHESTFQTSLVAHGILTGCIVALTIGYAIFVPGVEIVLGYTGAIFCSAVIYIVPGLVGVKIARRFDDRTWRRSFSWWMVLLGSLFTAMGVATTTMDLVD